MRALVTGGGGQLASDLRDVLGEDAVLRTHAELDITDAQAVAAAVEDVRPDVIFNCAAFHNVDECEREPDQAWTTNVRAVRDLARQGVKLVHLSTNYVFDGRREEPYAEDDLPRPRSVYALTKLAGEHAALAYGDRAVVVRTAGLYGLAGNASKGGNFVQRMLERARTSGQLRMVHDQRLQPTFTADLAAAVVDAVRRDAAGVVHLVNSGACSWLEFTEDLARGLVDAVERDVRGVLHLVNEGAMSWHQFTVAIMHNAGIDVPVEAVETTIPEGGVDRPLNGVLARPRADALGLPRLRPVAEALEDYMSRAGLSAGAAA